MKKIILLPILLIVVIFVISGCVNSTTSDIEAEPTAEKTPTESQPTSPENIKEFIMTAQKWDFDPVEITVNQGDTVRLRITSTDVKHGIAIPDFNVNVDLDPNVETEVEFVADKSGTFTFYCSVFCGSGHKDMKGTLIVK
jgi:cytochrome c oxidase subunit 2